MKKRVVFWGSGFCILAIILAVYVGVYSNTEQAQSGVFVKGHSHELTHTITPTPTLMVRLISPPEPEPDYYEVWWVKGMYPTIQEAMSQKLEGPVQVPASQFQSGYSVSIPNLEADWYTEIFISKKEGFEDYISTRYLNLTEGSFYTRPQFDLVPGTRKLTVNITVPADPPPDSYSIHWLQGIHTASETLNAKTGGNSVDNLGPADFADGYALDNLTGGQQYTVVLVAHKAGFNNGISRSIKAMSLTETFTGVPAIIVNGVNGGRNGYAVNLTMPAEPGPDYYEIWLRQGNFSATPGAVVSGGVLITDILPGSFPCFINDINTNTQYTITAVAKRTGFTDLHSNAPVIQTPDMVSPLIHQGGPSWTHAKTGFSGSSWAITSVAYNGGGRWVAVGGNNQIATSTNGRDWTKSRGPFRAKAHDQNQIWSVAYGNGVWVAVGSQGKIARSADGLRWSLAARRPFTEGLRTVAFANGKFIAGGERGKMAWSTNGSTWTSMGSPAHDSGTIWKIAGNGGNTWVAVGMNGKCLYSTNNGMSWSKAANHPFGSHWIQALAYGNGQWVAAGSGGILAVSTDGVNWSLRDSGSWYTITCLVYGYGLWVGANAQGEILKSVDPAAGWTLIPSGTIPHISPAFGNNPIRSIAWGSGKWVAVGDNGIAAHGSPAWLEP